MDTYKIVIVGDSGSGKTSFLRHIINGEYSDKHNPTLGVEVHPFRPLPGYGNIVFNFWDTGADKRYEGLKEEYYVNADAFIIFYTDRSTIKKWRDLLPGDTPILLCRNKCDTSASRGFFFDREISVKNDSGCRLVISDLVKRLSRPK